MTKPEGSLRGVIEAETSPNSNLRGITGKPMHSSMHVVAYVDSLVLIERQNMRHRADFTPLLVPWIVARITTMILKICYMIDHLASNSKVR